MPELGEYDELSHTLASKEDIDNARLTAETLIPTKYGVLQYDLMSRQRITDAIVANKGMDSISWRFLDNSEVLMSVTDFIEMDKDASLYVGPHSNSIFNKAKQLKDRLRAGGTVSLREIDADSWLK